MQKTMAALAEDIRMGRISECNTMDEKLARLAILIAEGTRNEGMGCIQMYKLAGMLKEVFNPEPKASGIRRATIKEVEALMWYTGEGKMQCRKELNAHFARKHAEQATTVEELREVILTMMPLANDYIESALERANGTAQDPSSEQAPQS